MGADLDVSGFSEIRREIDQLGTKGKRTESKALKLAGNILANEMASLVNLSGISDPSYKHLKENIGVGRTKTNEFGERYVEIGADKEIAWRAKFLEFGTVKMSPRPFMEPALDEKKEEVNRVLIEALKKGLGL